MSITIKAIDILKEEHDKYTVREIHSDGHAGQIYKDYGRPIYSRATAWDQALRLKSSLPVRVEFLGIVEAVE